MDAHRGGTHPARAPGATPRVAPVAACLSVVVCLGLATCVQTPDDPMDGATPHVSDVPPDASDLTATAESEHFVFHFEPGDTVEIERSEAFHRWAVAYFGVTPPKKIDFYKYRTPEDLAAAVGQPVGGIARASEFAVYTFYSWHNHECVHLYSFLWGLPPMFFTEGFAVANEVDPYNDDWVPRHNRTFGAEPYIDMVLSWRATDSLLALRPLLSSGTFATLSHTEARRPYREAGMFVSYLIDRFGLQTLKRVFGTMRWGDSVETVASEFQSIFGISVEKAEADWLMHLDSLNSSRGVAVSPTGTEERGGTSGLHARRW